MTPLSWFTKCVKHDRKVPRSFHRALRRTRPGLKHSRQRHKIIALWQRYVAKRRQVRRPA